MSIRVGEVIAVHGTKVVLKIDEQSSKETLFFEGDRYKGVSIREYLSIQRGFRDIICTVEGEYLDESRTELQDGKQNFVRKVEARPIGYFDHAGFTQGIKYLPMIQDSAYLMPEEKIRSIFDRKADGDFRIGQMLKEEIAVGLPWRRLFNSHIGIFGNTGSGKSNTLAKLYTVLFDKKLPMIAGKSRFVVLDFNGEYGGEQLAPAASKTVYQLSTLTIPDPNDLTARFPWHHRNSGNWRPWRCCSKPPPIRSARFSIGSSRASNGSAQTRRHWQPTQRLSSSNPSAPVRPSRPHWI